MKRAAVVAEAFFVTPLILEIHSGNAVRKPAAKPYRRRDSRRRGRGENSFPIRRTICRTSRFLTFHRTKLLREGFPFQIL